MLATSERDSPCSARWRRSSSGRVTTSSSPSWVMVMPVGSSRSSWPWGPLTLTELPLRVTVTLEGTGMGERPMRDIRPHPVLVPERGGHSALPDMAEHLAAQMLPPGLTVGHQALAGREHGHAHPTQHARDAVGAGVNAQARAWRSA